MSLDIVDCCPMLEGETDIFNGGRRSTAKQCNTNQRTPGYHTRAPHTEVKGTLFIGLLRAAKIHGADDPDLVMETLVSINIF